MFTSCASEGLKMSEVPISYAPRIGESKLGSIGDGGEFCKLLVRKMFLDLKQSLID